MRLWATWYHVPIVDAVPDGFPLLNVADKPISPLIRGRDWCLGALQGVIAIKAGDGAMKTYTYETTAQTEELDCGEHFQRPRAWARTAGRSRFDVSKRSVRRRRGWLPAGAVPQPRRRTRR